MVPLLYNGTKIIVRLLLFLLTCQQVKGRENVPSRGPIIIVANHLSLADPPLLGASVNQRLVFMGKEELFHYRFLKYVVRGLGAIPMRRGRMLRNSIHQAEQVLARGQTLALFPEGGRSHNGQLCPGLPGTVLIALRSAAPILPVGITGTEKVKGLTWLLRRPQITVNIGLPFYLTSTRRNPTKKELAEHVNFIMGRIAALLPVEYQGCYAKLVD